jgi:hypothetical protein
MSARSVSLASSVFFDSKTLLDQQPRQRSRMGLYPTLGQKPRRQFGHRDVAIGIHPTCQNLNMRSKRATPRRTALPGGRNRTRLRLALRQTNRCRRTHPKTTRRRSAGLTALNLANNPNPKINRTALAHDPPPIKENHKTQIKGIPRSRFSVQRSKY